MSNLRKDSNNKLIKASSLANVEFNNPITMPADFGITGSTFRAYRNCVISPSKIYKSWAASDGYEIINKATITSRAEFLTLHGSLALSFEKQWNAEGNRTLAVSEKYKIIDLFVKAVAFFTSHPCISSRKALYHYANIPLDKFSLLAIQELYYGIVISGSPSMGDIKDVETYSYLQDIIFGTMTSLKMPNLVFDHYAWNSHH